MTVEDTGALLFVREVVSAFHLDAVNRVLTATLPTFLPPGHLLAQHPLVPIMVFGGTFL